MNKSEQREYKRKYNLNRKKNGICLKCGKPSRENRVYCFDCGVYYAQRSADYYRRKKKKFKMDKFKTCKDCPDRTIEPNCHENCEGYNYRKSENEKLYEERKKRCDYITFKGHAINYNVRGASNGMLRVRKGDGQNG